MTVFCYVFFVLLYEVVQSNILDNCFKMLSVASPNSNYGVLCFVCSFKAVVRSIVA